MTRDGARVFLLTLRGYLDECATDKDVEGDIDAVVALIMAEHERFSATCLNEKVSGETGTDSDKAYNQACEDCARAAFATYYLPDTKEGSA